MKTTETDTRVCAHCHRVLPASEFYVSHQTGKPDSYCKECRRRLSLARFCGVNDLPPDYPVITRTDDPDERLALVLHACKVLKQSVMRKREKRIQEDYLS